MSLAHANRMKSLAEKSNQCDEKINAWEIEVAKANKWIEKLEAELNSVDK